MFGGRPLDFASCAWAFPIAGLVATAPAIAVMGALWPWLPNASAVPLVLGYAALLATSGALHEDGAADVADGFWGGGTPERRLEIMRDSRIGTYGTLALVVVLLFRIAALHEVSRQLEVGERTGDVGGGRFPTLVALFAASVVVGKVALLDHWWASSTARSHGLARRFGAPDGRQFAIAGVLSVAIVLLVVPVGWMPLAVAFFLAAVFGRLFTRLAQAKIGGHTGDTLGAAAVIGECAFLLGVLLTISHP